MRGNLHFLAAWANKTESRIEYQANEATKKVAIRVLEVLVHNTPVDTSQALSNWRVGVKSRRPTKTIPPYYPGTYGSTRESSAGAAIRAGTELIKTREKKKTIHIANNLDYIEGLDAGTISRQPGAFVAKAILAGNNMIANTKLNLDR
jgi:hypothetical protein